MNKKVFKFFVACMVFWAVAFGTIGFYTHKSLSEDALFLLKNVEALTFGEDVLTFHCKGNTEVCAKGTDENTGREFIIHGRLTEI